jgi:cyclophilin family peptidyl-prolyl cis-trans isomerase
MKRAGVIVVALLLVGILVVAFLASSPSGPNPVVVMETSMGTIKMELYQDKAPITVDNFLKYVDDKHYDGTIFHRVISGFMVQGGGMGPDMQEKRGRPPIKNEAYNGLANNRGTLAMARTGQRHRAVLH